MASIKDVANLANVSISTVSIIINGKSKERKISLETQKKVKDAMKQLNYQPNLSAQKLRSLQNEKMIALFWTTDFRDVMLARFLNELQSAIKKNNLDYDIIIYPYENNHLCNEASLSKISNFHGAIIANASQEDLNFLKKLDPMIPIVLYNRDIEHYSSVTIDDSIIANNAYQLLKDKKRIALIQAPYAFEGMKTRDEQFIHSFNHDITTYQAKINSSQGGYHIAKEIDFNAVDVLYTASDMIALGIMHYCFKHHIKIPEDVEILSIGNGLSNIDEFLNPSLSVIQIPMEKMAEECITIISQLFKKPIIIKKTIEPQIIIRDSLIIKD